MKPLRSKLFFFGSRNDYNGKIIKDGHEIRVVVNGTSDDLDNQLYFKARENLKELERARTLLILDNKKYKEWKLKNLKKKVTVKKSIQ